MKKRLVVIFFVMGSFTMQARYNGFKTVFNMLRSAVLFHISLAYSNFIYGASCTFDTVCSGDDATAGIVRDADGCIMSICDGKKTPLVLGSIPRTKKHIEKIRLVYGLVEDDIVELFTLNRKFECDWAGLSALVEQSDESVRFFTYPTTDFMAPSMKKLIRAVYMLRERDKRDGAIAYVHCKAGKGRSATVVAAYLATIVHDTGESISVEELESFLRARRVQVGLNREQKQRVQEFIDRLYIVDNFDSLYKCFASDSQ